MSVNTFSCGHRASCFETHEFLFYFYKASKEAKEAEQHAKDLGVDKDGSLKQLILQRQGDRKKEMNNFYDDLEAKYSKPTKQKKTGSASKSTKRKRK